MSAFTAWARTVGEERLASPLPRRWSHVRGVADQASAVAAAVGVEKDLLVAAAWLHDVGYAPDLVDTGFHPLDGARHLRRLGAADRLCGLVANHSHAALEAELRGLGDVLAAEFPAEVSPTVDALCYADMTTSPDGERVSVDERLSEIEARYGPDHLVTTFIRQAGPELLAACERTEARLTSGQPR